ncbi:hypothetical protein B0H12DRAFT_138577 [Mycena haematopus]|nr:hypothetical protein B0H12DRAFT_138577 [Mycena haematopus]
MTLHLERETGWHGWFIIYLWWVIQCSHCQLYCNCTQIVLDLIRTKMPGPCRSPCTLHALQRDCAFGSGMPPEPRLHQSCINHDPHCSYFSQSRPLQTARRSPLCRSDNSPFFHPYALS